MTADGVGVQIIGLMTTAPLIMFGLAGFFAGAIGGRIGFARALGLGLLILSAGCLLRSWGSGGADLGKILGSILIGTGIAFGNVLMPGIVKSRFPEKMGLMTSLYSTGINLGGALGIALAVPFAVGLGGSWNASLGAWGFVAMLPFLLWIPQMLKKPAVRQVGNPFSGIRHLFGRVRAWQVTAQMGMQSLLFYSSVAWLPTMLQLRGMSESASYGWPTIMQLCGCGASLIIPTLAGRSHSQSFWLVGSSLMTISGICGILWLPLSFVGVATILMGLGLNAGFSMSLLLIAMRSRDAETAGNLSSMAQSIGYLVAAPFPWFIGWLHTATDSWTMAYGFLLVPATEAELAALKAAIDEYESAWAAGDFLKVESFFTEDAKRLHTEPHVWDRAEIRRYFESEAAATGGTPSPEAPADWKAGREYLEIRAGFSRRNFLGTTASGLIASAAGLRGIARAAEDAAGAKAGAGGKEVRWGFVGTGGIANSMAKTLRLTTAGRLAASSSRSMESAEEFAAEYGAEKAFDSWQEMMEWDGIDAVYVATPTSVREEICLAAAKAGKHVLGEKPFASLESVKKITGACRENGVAFMDGTHFSHHPRTTGLRGKLDTLVGERRSVNSVFQFHLRDRTNIRMQPALEPMGSIGDAGWYNMRAIVDYLDPGVELAGLSAYLRRDSENGAVIGGTGVLAFADGSRSTWTCGFDAGTVRSDLSIDGKTGAVDIRGFVGHDKDYSASYQYRSRSGKGKPVDEVVRIESALPASALMFEDFAAQVHDESLREQWATKTLRTQELLDAVAAFSQAAVIYYQDFSASNPVDASGAINPIIDDTIYASTGQNITGGSAGSQVTNGDYTIDLIRSNAATDRGFVFNSTATSITDQTATNANPTVSPLPGAGFAAIDVNYVFTTGSITIDDQGTSRTGTVAISAAALNVGGEFLSLNFIRIEENDATGEVTLTIDYNAYGDWAVGGNEDILVTTNFGGTNDLTSFDIALLQENNAAIEDTYTFQLVEGIPEPSSAALLGLGGLGLLLPNAATLAGYSINDTAGLTADTLAGGVTSTALSSPAWTLAIANDDFLNIAESAGMAGGLGDDMDGAFTAGQFLEFTMSTTGTFDLAQLQLTLERSSRGPQDFAVRISSDGFASGNSDVGFFEQTYTNEPVGETAQLFTVDLSGITFDSSADLSFRIAYDDRANSGSSNSAGRFYDIAVTSVPEPSSAAMLISGLGMIALFRRRQA
eukprot:g4065.t1